MTIWTVAHQGPLSMGFFRQEYWNGLLCPPSGDPPDQGIKPTSFTSPTLAGGFCTTSATWEAHIHACVCVCVCVCVHNLRKDLHFWLEFSFLLYNKLRTVIIFTVLCKNIVFHQFRSEIYGLKECLNVEGGKQRKDLNIMQEAVLRWWRNRTWRPLSPPQIHQKNI